MRTLRILIAVLALAALVAGQVDMIGACITITDARKQQILFSASYYMGGISALVRK